MKNNYISTASRWLFLFSLLISQALFAQTAPFVQWQKLLYGPAKQADNGDIILGSGTTVSRLNQDTGASKWQTTLPDGFEANIVYDLVIASDGSIVTLTKDRTKWSLIKLDANGAVVWNKSFAGVTPSGELFQRFITNVVQGKDGNYVVMGYSSFPRAGANTELYLIGTDGTLLKSGGAGYSYPNATRPSSVGNKIIATADGGFLLVGGTDSGAEPSAVGWAAKLDQNLNQVWTDRYNFANNFTDVILSPFNSAAFIASGISLDRKGTVTLVISPTQPSVNNTAGTYRPSPSYVTLTNSPNDGITSNRSVDPKIVSGSGNSYEVIDAIDQRLGDIRITSFASNNQIRWTKILGGSSADVATNIISTQGGGYLLTALTQSTDGDVQGKTDNSVSGWLVKLAPGGPLTIGQPTYNCSTGAITINTSGGDGSPITYSAPGVTRSSATSNTGTVEQGLRNDPKPITITATQNGYSDRIVFDFNAFCLYNEGPLYRIILKSPIPDQSRPVNVQIVGNVIPINSYFSDNYPAIRYPTIVRYRADGLPPGLVLFDSSNSERKLAYIGGTPTVTGTYSVTVTAYANIFPPEPGVSTTFRITITDGPVVTPPPTTGGTLTLTQPTYNCSTGAITFNTTGGDGSTITYTAPGIMRSSVTSSTGIVEQGLRNDPKTITITAMQNGYSTSYSFDFKAFCSGNPPAPFSTLKLLAPVVDCLSRQVTLVTSGGDGSAITFNTPTITRSSATSTTGLVDLCVGAQPPVLQATQSGYTATYQGFDFAAVCPSALSIKPLIARPIPDYTITSSAGLYDTGLGSYFTNPTIPINRFLPRFSFSINGTPTGSTLSYESGLSSNLQPVLYFRVPPMTAVGVYTVTITGENECQTTASTTFKVTVTGSLVSTNTLTLTQPTYTCSTGAITFNYTGGNGSPVEFQAAGITGWTTNPNQFVDRDSRTANDVKPFTLMARQNGQVVTYTWDLKAACGRSARMAAEAGQGLQLTVKGNPVGNTAIVDISGVDGQPVQLDLLNATGHVLEQRHIEQAGVVEEQRFELQRQPSGMLFLRAQSGQQLQTVKLIKQ